MPKPPLSSTFMRCHATLLLARQGLRKEAKRRRIAEQKLVQAAHHYDQLLTRSRRMHEQSRQLAHQILLAQEEERREISRELHDEIAQILAGINVQLSSLKDASAINDRSLRKKIGTTQRMVEKSVDVVHRFARELRPSMLDDLGLIPALRTFIKDLPKHKGLSIRFTANPEVEALDNKRRTVLYRVAQEALTNIDRHARASAASVRITKRENAVRLVIQDNGRAFQANRHLRTSTGKRLGIVGMRERVEMVKGCFSISSSPGKGTTVCAEIPFDFSPAKPSS